MDPLTIGLLGGAGLGLAKGLLVDQPAADRQRKVSAVEARYSPWTGIKPEQIQEANPMGSAMQGGMTGAMVGQGVGQTDKMNALMDSQKGLMDAQTASLTANGAASAAPAAAASSPTYLTSPGAVQYAPGAGQGMIRSAQPTYGQSMPWLAMGR